MKARQLLLCLLVGLTSHLATASITIVETGQVFPSEPDKLLGQKLWKGYQYMGRMQLIDTNLQLCNVGEALNVVVPKESVPVAILAAAGGCSLEQKAIVASTMMAPANIVTYLIAEDNGRSNTLPIQEDMDNQNHSDWDVETKDNEENVEDEEGFGFSFLRKRTHNPDIQVAVLNVSSRTYASFRTILKHESVVTREKGGTQIVLNSANPKSTARSIFVWMSISMAFFGCSCFCVVLLHHNGIIAFASEENEQAAPSRPVRRRLTVQQVRDKYPSFYYQHPNQHKANQDGQGGEDASVSSDVCLECSICLDEYEPGVRLRELPCGHVFHSTCICRWLVERHAVCPLCKIDLYEEEEEEDDSSNSSSSASGSSAEEVEAAEAAMEVVNTTNTSGSSGSSSWWSTTTQRSIRWLSRRRRGAREDDGDRLTELTEPLISNSTSQNASNNSNENDGNSEHEEVEQEEETVARADDEIEREQSTSNAHMAEV